MTVKESKDSKAVQDMMNLWDEYLEGSASLDVPLVQQIKTRMPVFQALIMDKLELWASSLQNFNSWQHLYDEFNYIIECLGGRYSNKTLKILQQHQQALLLDTDVEHMKTLNYDAEFEYLRDIAQQRLELLWFYAVTICRLLQQNEWYLTPVDAYWLGLIDTVLGYDI